MSSTEKPQETQQPPPGASPAYPTQMPAPAPPAYPLKHETPQVNQRSTAPAPASVGRRYQEQLYDSCAMGHHDRTSKYGICGILTAIFCFPCGLICLFADREVRCARCGVQLI